MYFNYKFISNYFICVFKYYRKKKQFICFNIINLIQNRGLGICIFNIIIENYFYGKFYSSNREEVVIDVFRKLKFRINKKVNIFFLVLVGYCRNVWED